MLTAEAHQRLEDTWTAKYAKVAGYAVYLVAVFYGMVEGAAPGAGVRVLVALAFAWSLALYCALDARRHGKVFVRMFWVASFAAWPVAPLFHFVRARGRRGALKYLAHAPLVVLAMFVAEESMRWVKR